MYRFHEEELIKLRGNNFRVDCIGKNDMTLISLANNFRDVYVYKPDKYPILIKNIRFYIVAVYLTDNDKSIAVVMSKTKKDGV